ncbi:MAG: hypothetical protein K2I81_02845 [Alphaproteobacteria bacterium]|nr:hypothetical protein [Alphaproteobacteria bacterium]
MKLNNLAGHAKYAALCSIIAMAAAACQSEQQTLSQLDSEINRLSEQIDSTYIHNEATDSAERNPLLQILNQWITNDAYRIDSLRLRNIALTDSIQKKNVRRASGQYPLSAFLSKSELKAIQNQLSDFHCSWNKKSANNIIAGRGTLLDLYNVSFDLDYALFEPSFHIINDLGYVRFDDARLNKICKQFETEKEALEMEEVSNQIRRRANKIEFAKNDKEIKEYERQCAISDSIYMEIENHFQPRIKHRIDSLMTARNNLRMERNKLAQRINQHQK